MRRTLVMGALLAAAMLAAPAAAYAKGNISAVTMCGPEGCGPPTASGAVRALSEQVMGMTGGPSRSTPPLGPYYRVGFQPAGEVPDTPTFYVAGAATLCVEQACVRIPAPVRALLERATAGVPAFHPSIRSVSIGGARAADASAFGALFDRLTPVPTAPATVWTSRAIPITVRLTPQSPWSATGTVSMTYFPQFHLLARGGAWIRVDAALDRGIVGESAAPAGGHDAALWIGMGTAALLAAALALWLAARRTASRRPKAA
ncbi:MAG TPA: hypothetical protein VE777_01665 [Gaiellales bacterium]|jgi:hypothetical protein|nr:hypothetical protein [Gaiellales bacterium]